MFQIGIRGRIFLITGSGTTLLLAVVIASILGLWGAIGAFEQAAASFTQLAAAAPERPDPLLRLAEELGPADKPPKGGKPLIEIARTKTRDEALAALDVWRARHPEAAAALEPTDILVDGMRGPSSIWYRIRINLEHVPQPQRPAQEELIADYSPWEGYSGHQRP